MDNGKTKSRDSVDLTKPTLLSFQANESNDDHYVFYAVIENKRIAVIIMERRTASLFPYYNLSKWARQQLVEEALNMMAAAVGEPTGPRKDVKEIETTITLN
jgi:hypothetical protein